MREVGPRHSSCEADEQSEESSLRRRLRGRSQRCRWSEGRGPRGIRTSKARTGLRTRLACHRRWSVYGNLEAWLREEHSRLSRSASVAQPIDYMLKRWDRFASFIEDGRVCLTNNAAERALRGFALGRKSW